METNVLMSSKAKKMNSKKNDIKKRKLTLEEIHSYELDMLQAFADVCEELDLPYFLAGGTLLGAIRHKGFIPWDDDIDVMMLRPDYDRFIQNAELVASKGPYKLAAYELGNLNYPFAKIYDKRTRIDKLYDNDATERNLWIDIFPIDGLPDDDRIVNQIYKKCFTARKILRLQSARPGQGKTALKRIVKPVLIMLSKPIGRKRILRYIDTLCRTYSPDECNFVGGISNGYGPQEKMPKKEFMDRVEVQFEDRTVYAPGCWDYYLSQLYGDYMKLPPEDQREDHSMTIWVKDKSAASGAADNANIANSEAE